MFDILDAKIESMQPHLSGVRFGLHCLTLVVMLGITFMTLISSHTLTNNPNYAWFVSHWPYNDRAWGCMFALFSLGGMLSFFGKSKWPKLVGALSLGSGHATIFHAITSVNPINTGVTTYGAITSASIVVLAIVLVEEKW